MTDDFEHLKNFKGVRVVKRYQFHFEKGIALGILFNRWVFPLEVTFLFPFFSLWIGIGKVREEFQ